MELISNRLPISQMGLERAAEILSFLPLKYRHSNHILKALETEIDKPKSAKNREKMKFDSDREWKGYAMMDVLELLNPDEVYKILTKGERGANIGMLFTCVHRGRWEDYTSFHMSDEYSNRFIDLLKKMTIEQQISILEAPYIFRYSSSPEIRNYYEHNIQKHKPLNGIIPPEYH